MNTQITKNALSKLLIEVQTWHDELKRSEQPYTWVARMGADLEKIEQKLKNQKFQVAVMALMKSGKSTLLNAWIGNEYLPSSNDAETIQVIRIEHDEMQNEGVLLSPKQEVLAKGAEKIRETIRSINKTGRDNKTYTDEELTLQVSLSALKGKLNGNVKFTILDTPGTDEKLPIVEENVKKLINEVDVVIYLMDFTKIDAEHERTILDNLKQLRNNLVQDKDRLFFVINKVDELGKNDKEKGITDMDKIVDMVKSKYLQKEKFDNHAVIPVSARRALYARLMLSNCATEEQKKEFYGEAFGNQYELMLKHFKGEFPSEMLQEAIENELKASNFNLLEIEILNVLSKKGDRILLKSAKDDLERCLKQVCNDISVEKGALETKEADINRTIAEANAILEKLNVINLEDEDFKKKVIELSQKGFDEFNESITETIKSEFRNNRFRQRSYFDSIKAKYPNFFIPNLILQFENEHQKEEIMADLNQNVSKAMRIEFDNYWTPVIKQIYIEYQSFARKVEDMIKPAIKEIEAVIEKGLNISLYDYEMGNIWVEEYQFFQDLTIGTNNLIKANKGWRLGWVFWIIPWPEKYIKNYTLNTDDYIQFLLDNAEKLIQEHILHISRIVENQLGTLIQNAQNQVEAYAQEYIDAMEYVIIQKQGGEEYIEERITQLSEHLDTCNQHLQTLSKIETEPVQNIQNQTANKIININNINNANFS